MILNKGATPEKPRMLCEVPAGTYLVEDVSGDDQYRLRLSEMGIVEGTPVSVLSCSKQGMSVIKVAGSRLALARGSTENIWVKSHSL